MKLLFGSDALNKFKGDDGRFSYGIFDEPKGWDENALSLLPDYLKTFYEKLLSNFKEFEDQVGVNEKYQAVHTIKEFQKLSTYYLQEAEWVHQKHKPSFDDQVTVYYVVGCALAMCVRDAWDW
ncbi:hypothetical protein E2562_027313 [Oryza meyeriana var. granulata]|uniref:Terpene synthase metal-binding domain-containing protein n=1 Tax=Oryza meyeriana var. granulata TaxID=110450 RepID=A0A6G1C0V8_9ORYZ|nr:hypothetical protein E2562_027313 [Oryza meyeriana var. granulata]